MSRTFQSITLSNNAQSAESNGEQSTNAKLETNSVLGIRNLKDSYSYHKK